MNTLKNLHIKLKNEFSKMPMRSTIGSAGFDIFSDKKIVLPEQKLVSIELPFCFEGELEEGYEIRLFVRSSFGFKKKMRLVKDDQKNIPYLILNPDKEKIVVTVLNDNGKDLVIEKGEHFAQFVVCKKDGKDTKIEFENVPNEEASKHNILPSKLVHKQGSLYEYVLLEDITLEANEQKMFATGYRVLLDEGTWSGITVHENVQEKVMLANQTAVIDRDYAFADNFGHCFVALVNLRNESITIKSGTSLLNWWSERFYTLTDEMKSNKHRTGGIGSTTE